MKEKNKMKTITKLIYVAVAGVSLAISAVTVNGAVNDLFASVNGNTQNGGGFITNTPRVECKAPLLPAFPGLAGWPLTILAIFLW
jgi:hypothetical protein